MKIPAALKIQILSLPEAFCTLPDSKGIAGWRQRRAILVDLAGDVTDDEIIARDASLAPVPKLLGRDSVEDFKKRQTARRKELTSQKANIPARIDELSRQLNSNPAQSSGDSSSLSGPALDLEDMRNRLKALALQRAELKAGGPDQVKRQELRRLEDEAEALARAVRQEADKKREEAERVHRQSEFVLRGETQKMEQLLHEIEMDEQALESCESALKTLKDEHARISAEVA